MKLIVGLGNPTKKYLHTRHNIGFFIVDKYLKNVEWKERFNSLYFEKIINGEKVVFVKPQTYMNLSGESVLSFVNYYKIEVSEILVIRDDIDMPFNKIKIKNASASGGHNGINSIISNLKSNEFIQFKVGVSRNETIDAKDFVLSKFSLKEQSDINESCITYNQVIDLFISNKIDVAMNKFN